MFANIILIMCRKENVWGNDELELEREQGKGKMQPYDESKEIESKRGANTEQEQREDHEREWKGEEGGDEMSQEILRIPYGGFDQTIGWQMGNISVEDGAAL